MRKQCRLIGSREKTEVWKGKLSVQGHVCPAVSVEKVINTENYV